MIARLRAQLIFCACVVPSTVLAQRPTAAISGMKRYLALASVLLALLWMPLNAPKASAQTINGTLLGTVQDQQGTVIPNAAVSARNAETGIARTTMADSAGAYRIPSVPAGPYEVAASAQGFKTEIRRGVSVTVGAEIKVDFVLDVGALEEKVIVSGETPQVDTTTSTIGGLVNEVTIRELPLNGRDWLQLALLQPGATFVAVQSQRDDQRMSRGNGQAISIYGGRTAENVYRIDGLVINDFTNSSPGSSLGVNLGVDAIREFSVLTDTYSAEYGRSSGGVINAITKSGANLLHGTAFYFHRNSALDARNFFDAQLPPFRRHQFGGSVGGPIRKDKTFFFASYEGLREFKSLSFSSNTLSPNARNGILSSGAPVTIDPRIKPYLDLYPLPNGPVTGDTAKYIFGGGRNGTENFVIGRIDHTFSEKTTLNATYRFDGAQVSAPDAFNEKLLAEQSRHQDVVLSLQHIFSSTVVNNVRAGVTRTHETAGFDVQPRLPQLADTSLSFLPGIPVGDFSVPGLSAFGGIGDTGADVAGYTAPQVYDDLSWTRGRHSLKIGFALERIYDNVDPRSTPNGQWVFGSIRDMLTAVPSQFTSAIPGSDTERGLRTTIIAAYLQDEFRLRSNLTLNLGVRYETATSIKEVNGKIGNLRNLTDAAPAVGNPLFLNPTLKNFAPRLGLAWDPFKDGKTSIRAGFGIYDIVPLPYLVWNKATHGLPFFQLGTVNFTTANPAGNNFPNKALGLIQASGLRAASIEYHPPRSYKMQWNLNIQRQIVKDLSLMVGYVGAGGVHLPIGYDDADLVPPNLTTRAPDGHYLFPTTGTIPRINPNFGRIDATRWNGHSSYHALQTNLIKRLNRGMTFQATYTWAKNIDNGSTVITSTETVNHSDTSYFFDPRINRAVSDFDVSHNAAINFTWEIPSPASLTGVSRFLLHGWQVGGIFAAQSGSPFSVRINSDQARSGTSLAGVRGGPEKPDYNPAPGCNPNATNPGNFSNYINTQCFSFPALGSLGNLGRNTLRGPGLQNLDFSVFKNHQLWGEKLKIQFRAEMFNLLNRANLQAQLVTLFDKQGKLVSTAGQLQPPTVTSARQIQFGMKFIW